MKRTIIDGEVGQEIKSQLDQVEALKRTIASISQTIYELENRIWEHVRKEYPNISKNSTISIVEGRVLLTDRLDD